MAKAQKVPLKWYVKRAILFIILALWQMHAVKMRNLVDVFVSMGLMYSFVSTNNSSECCVPPTPACNLCFFPYFCSQQDAKDNIWNKGSGSKQDTKDCILRGFTIYTLLQIMEHLNQGWYAKEVCTTRGRYKKWICNFCLKNEGKRSSGRPERRWRVVREWVGRSGLDSSALG
jgi:hypothetical protein